MSQQGLDHATGSQDDRNFLYINQRLMALNEGKDPFKLESMGLIKRLGVSSWERIGSSYHPRMPSKDSKPV